MDKKRVGSQSNTCRMFLLNQFDKCQKEKKANTNFENQGSLVWRKPEV